MDFINVIYTALHTTIDPQMWSEIYQTTFFWSALITIIICVSFYYIFNSFSAKLYKRWIWFVFFGINAALDFFAANIISVNLGEFDWFFVDVLWFAVINMIYFSIIFFVMSIMIKCKSPHGKYSPFKFPCK